MLSDGLLQGLPNALIRAALASAPGNEIESGKFFSPESSSALVANVFGLFLDRPALLPPLPAQVGSGWPASTVRLESIVRFPWASGRHPCLDVLIETAAAVIGIESKRFEPFRSKKKPDWSEAYWRPVWGDQMGRYEAVRDRLRSGDLRFRRLDAAQLIKHAFGLRTTVQSSFGLPGRTPALVYLYAEPLK